MSYEENDWIMRQIKQLAIGLGKMLNRDSLKEIINLELSTSEQLTDTEIDTIMLLVGVNEKIENEPLKIPDYTEKIGISLERLREILQDYTQVNPEELINLKKFVETDK